MPNRFLNRTEAKACKNLTNLLGKKLKEVHNELGFSREALSKNRVLRGNTDWASIQVTNSHENTARHHKWCSCKSKLFGAQKSGNNDIPSCLHLAVNLNRDAIAKSIKHECLLCLGKAQLPGGSCMFQRVQWRGSSTAIVS